MKLRPSLALYSFVIMALIGAFVLSAGAKPSSVAAATALTPGLNKQRVTFKDGDLTLVGFLYKPDGNGPFPAIIWNHGSEQNPGTGPEYDSVAAIFVPAGYVVFGP